MFTSCCSCKSLKLESVQLALFLFPYPLWASLETPSKIESVTERCSCDPLMVDWSLIDRLGRYEGRSSSDGL